MNSIFVLTMFLLSVKNPVPSTLILQLPTHELCVKAGASLANDYKSLSDSLLNGFRTAYTCTEIGGETL